MNPGIDRYDDAGRLSLAYSRHLLGPEADSMSDDEVLKLRDEMYMLSDVVMNFVVQEHAKAAS